MTFNLHIMVRVELEQVLIEGALKPDDVPGAWNERMQAHPGVTPDRAADGILQDVHWSIGAFGFFPTYTLGNLYAARFFEQARTDLPRWGQRSRPDACQFSPSD